MIGNSWGKMKYENLINERKEGKLFFI